MPGRWTGKASARTAAGQPERERVDADARPRSARTAEQGKARVGATGIRAVPRAARALLSAALAPGGRRSGTTRHVQRLHVRGHGRRATTGSPRRPGGRLTSRAKSTQAPIGVRATAKASGQVPVRRHAEAPRRVPHARGRDPSRAQRQAQLSGKARRLRARGGVGARGWQVAGEGQGHLRVEVRLCCRESARRGAQRPMVGAVGRIAAGGPSTPRRALVP